MASGRQQVIGTAEPGRDATVPGALPGRSLWPWAGSFALVFGVLLARNAFLFTAPQYEDADPGANSILIEQARHFTLLVGNYSRVGFNHPGPAVLYVESWGETLFWSALHLVPAAWNGQLIALYALNALFAAMVVAAGYGWARSARGALAVLAVVLLYAALHPAAYSSPWMPYVYVPAYLAFGASVSSVAAGRPRDSWMAALSGWFLIHGHACFLFFVPLISLAAAAVLAWTRFRSRSRPPGPPGPAGPPGGRWRAWLPAAVISAVFALPIVVELALHWPGNFGKYFSYSSAPARPAGRGAARIADYTLWFWWPHGYAWAVLVILAALAGLVTWRLPAGPVRRFCAALLAFDAISTAAFAVYAVAGIDDLSQYYIGYFYWSAPVIMVLIIALGAVEALAPVRLRLAPARSLPAGLAVAAVAAAAAVVAFAIAPQTRTSTAHADPANPVATGAITDPSLPAGVARLAALSGGRVIELRFTHDAWPAVTGILVQAERAGVRACVADPHWKFMVTSEFICTAAELANARQFRLSPPGAVPHGMPVVFRLRRAIVTGTGK